MDLLTLRFNDNGDSTNGLLFEKLQDDKKKFMCYTLEDEGRQKKVYGETRIPDGTYKIKLRKVGGFHKRYSEIFSDIHIGMLELVDVPGFKHILIHCGNDDEDTSGCLLVGDTQENNDQKKDGFIGKSRQAYKRIYKHIVEALNRGEEVNIEYKTI